MFRSGRGQRKSTRKCEMGIQPKKCSDGLGAATRRCQHTCSGSTKPKIQALYFTIRTSQPDTMLTGIHATVEIDCFAEDQKTRAATRGPEDGPSLHLSHVGSDARAAAASAAASQGRSLPRSLPRQPAPPSLDKSQPSLYPQMSCHQQAALPLAI